MKKGRKKTEQAKKPTAEPRIPFHNGTTGGQVFCSYTISVNVDEEIGRLGIWVKLKVADYRDGGGGYCNQSGMTESE